MAIFPPSVPKEILCPESARDLGAFEFFTQTWPVIYSQIERGDWGEEHTPLYAFQRPGECVWVPATGGM